MGNISVEQATENTLAVLESAGYGDVEVAQGAARPLVRDHVPFPVVHGERGLGRAAPPPARRRPPTATPRSSCSSRRRATGRARCCSSRPDRSRTSRSRSGGAGLPELLGGFALMGGAFERGGNVTPAAEANIWVDPDAAAGCSPRSPGVDEDKLPICVGLDVTERVTCTAATSTRSARRRRTRRSDS